MKALKTLIVEDSKDDAELLLRHLSNGGYDVQAKIVQTPEDLKAALIESEWEIILSDYSMPHFTGLDALAVLKETEIDIPIIIISGTIGEDVAVDAMVVGVDDYLMKDNLTRLAPVIERELENAASRRAQKKAEEALRRSEASLARAQRIAHLGNWDWDIQNDELFWSDEIYRIFGVEKNQFQGTYKNFFERIHPEDRELVQSKVDATLTRNAEHTYEHRIVRPDGEERIVCEIGEVTFDETGKPIRFTGTVQDITERKRAEQITLESEEKYRNIVETANEGIWVVNADALTTYVNRQMAEMLGYTVDEMAGRPISDFIFEADFPAAEQKIEERKKGETGTGEFRLRRKDGSEITALYNANPIKNQAGEITGFLSMNTDITERRKAEESIRFQAQLLDTVEQAVIATDLDRNVIYWNKFAEKLYGWTAAEAVGRNVREVTMPETRSEPADEIAARLNEGKSWSGEFVVRGKTGAAFPAHISNSPVNDSKGNLIGVVGVSVDITERKRAEETLRKAESQYRSLVESSPAIVYLDQPYPPYSPIYISPNVLRFGYTTEEWISRPDMWVSIIHQDDRERVLAVAKAAAERGGETDFEYRIVARDGTVFWIHDKGQVVTNEQGEKTGWQGVMVDITKTKELEEQLRQAQKLESVGRLAGGIAHDFNNMLTAINGYSDLTLRLLKEDDPLRGNITEIKKAGERSALLTYQLLAFSRQQLLHPIVVDINETITDTIKIIQRLIGEDIQLLPVLDAKIGRVKVDPGQISQILMNLAVNARDAMPSGGKLTIETANVFVEADAVSSRDGILPGAYVMLSVSDNGSGMNEETKQKIFEPFFTTKEVGKGTGLGLATVYGIVKQSGGNIEVVSEERVGTTFRIYLPRVMEQAKLENTKDAFNELLKGTETILLVEDEEIVRNLTRQILEDCGYSVIEARNGIEALELCSDGGCQFDLLMTDVVMPHMGGRELVEKLKISMPNLRVLFTSGYTDDEVVRHGIIEISTNFIQKPFTPKDLANKIREIIDNS